MKSRIPHTKRSSGHDQSQAPAPNGQASDVHAALLALGAPLISQEEFARLYKGPFAEVLQFMSQHIKGRQAVARDRYLIHQIREARGKSHIPRPDDATRSPVDRSMVTLGAAQRAVQVSKAQLDERQAALTQLHSKFTELKAALANKRQVAVLLRVLEQRERVRIKRFQEMTRIMDTLRRTAVEEASLKPSEEPSQGISPLPPLPRKSLTQETLTNLHAYRIRLARITRTDEEPSSLLTSRLRSRLAKIIRVDQEIERVLQNYCKVARARADQAIKYRDPRLRGLPDVSKGKLETKLVINRERRQELQKLSDNVVALGFLCEHLIDSISVFFEQTSPILRSSIREETPLAKGYIDVLRLLISAQAESKVKGECFMEEVQRACRIRVPNEQSTIMQEVERLLDRSYQRSTFLRSIDGLQAPSQTSEEQALISSYQTGFDSVEERARKLLTRKVDKAALGDSLVEDIGTLLRDVRTIVG